MIYFVVGLLIGFVAGWAACKHRADLKAKATEEFKAIKNKASA